MLDASTVRASIAWRLGADIGARQPANRNVDGIVGVMLDATGKFDEPLTVDRLLAWHAALFPTGRSGMAKIHVGAWHDDARGSMQVVSGAYGGEKVHYTAPPAERVAQEMEAFLDWFNQPPTSDPVACGA